MTVIRIPPTLREETRGEREVIADGETVRELLDDLVSRFPALHPQVLEDGELAPFVNVYVEGEDVRTREGLETPVSEASTVILLPAMAGGSWHVWPPSSSAGQSPASTGADAADGEIQRSGRLPLPVRTVLRDPRLSLLSAATQTRQAAA